MAGSNDDCSCGKPKPGPLGGGQKPAENSGGLSAQTQSFSVSSLPGKTFASTLEARAALVRAGGGEIRPA